MLCSQDQGAIFDRLSEDYAETPAAIGVVANRQKQTPTLVLTRDEETSWSIVIVTEDSACIAFTGGAWQTVRGFDAGGYE